MQWTIVWIVIVVVAIFVMVRGCGRMMSGMRGGGCGMPPRRDEKQRNEHDKPGSAGKVA